MSRFAFSHPPHHPVSGVPVSARRRRRCGLVLSSLAIASAVLGCGHDELVAPDAGTDTVAFAPGQGAVHGYVDATTGTPFALPDATIQLKRLSDSSLTPAVTTDVHGAFTASGVPVGSYVICLSGTPGFSNACTSNSFTVSAGKIAYPPHAVFSPLRVAVFGRVRLAGPADVHYENSLFGKQVDTFVRALTTGGVLAAGPVRANSRGQYVLRQLSPGTTYHIVVQSETTVVDNLITTGTVPFKKDVTLPNHHPNVDEVNALQGGVTVRHVAVGSVVTAVARASDPDGNTLHYQWLAPGGGSCPTTDAATVNCTVSTSLGIQSIYVQVSDGAGQYAVGRVQVSVGPAISLFSGKVITDGNVAVPGAEIRVNGAATTSAANGGFSLTVPETSRYVLTIKKDGFQMISKVYLAERVGAVYLLRKVTGQVIDPSKLNTVQLRVPPNQTGGGSFENAVVTLHPGSIVDSAGHKVTTPVTVYGSRIDHLFDTFDRMPGDSGAQRTDGSDATLVSYGVVEVNLRGPGGEKYNLAPGQPADLKYPVHPSQIASAPPTLPLWYYDEDTGLWREDGVATLSSGAYLAQAKHFTAINVDLAKKDWTCLKIVVDQTTLTVPFKVRLTVPGFPVVDRDVTENVQAITRLPSNINGAQLQVYDSDGVTLIPNSVRNFNTGDPMPPGTDYHIPSPYNICITPPSPPVTLGLDLPQNPNPYFWLTRKINPGATDTDRANYANDYYTAIQADANLTAWKIRNEFNLGDDAQAYYVNAADLEFGRSMHMKKRSDGGIAYYVTNFADADKALAGNPADVIATVAMEYSKYPQPANGAPRFTKFYVFDKAGNLINRAELDNRGDKYVPGLCVVCHGGTLPPNPATASPAGNTESRFIPFDLKSFTVSPLLSGFPVSLDRTAQEEDFRKLNEGVYLFTGATDAQKALIEAWYSNVSGIGQAQQDAGVPFNWQGGANETFYKDVVAPSCRSCHNSRPPGIDFNDPGSFTGAGPESAVCTGGYMPQSFVAWRNFWHSTSPHEPTRVEQFLGLVAGTCVGPQ